ncbi:MAG TPA: IS1 family transposase [Terriglobales bacterium]
MTCIRCQHQNCKRFGYLGKRRIQRWRCQSCNTTFVEPHANLGTHYISPERAAQALSMMLEGMSIRAISRLTALHKNTVLSLMLTAATNAKRHFDTIRNLQPHYLQCDEIWCFVGKKARRVRKTDSTEIGDQWVFIALDAETKLVPCFEIGKRTNETTLRFLANLKRCLSPERFQLTTDGFHFYERGVEDVFAGQADFAQLVKLFGDYGQFETTEARYSPPRITEVISKVRDGRPDPDHISTSHVERSNLNLRMHLRRFTRLTNAHSKKLENLKAAVTLYFAWYNYVRVSQAHRVTPAMEAGLTDHVWSLAELLGAD